MVTMYWVTLATFFCFWFTCSATVKLLYFFCYFQTELLYTLFDMPGLNRKEKVLWENCGTQTAKLNLNRHKKRCSSETLISPSCTQFSTKSRAEKSYHFVKKRSKSTVRFVRKRKFCDKDIHRFYLLREHIRNEHGAQRISTAQIVYVTQLNGAVDDNSLKEDLETCKHFLVNSEMMNGTHRF